MVQITRPLTLRIDQRFIPFIALHEFEALLFSDTQILAKELGIAESEINAVLTECGEAEAINNSPDTAPSKRLDSWAKGKKFPKTSMGINIAEKIGVEKMREKCPVFDSWLKTLETIQQSGTPS